MPRLSFVVPVFRPKLDIFKRHCESLRDQALEKWEAIFVLDGACPEAHAIINKVFKKDSRVKIAEIIHAGAQAARNHGGALAQGEFLCFFDCDCVIEPGAPAMWVEQFDKHPEIGFIYSGYKFFGDKYAIESEPFDLFTLRIRNYISGCFPIRKTIYPGWTEGLKSLQDWDMWLSAIEMAKDQGLDVTRLGMYVPGYAFSTAMPDTESISGQGCAPEAWLGRLNAVKELHRLPKRDICVSSLQYRHDGLALARILDADYLDNPTDKPHEYKTLIQIGFSLGGNSEKHAAIFQDKGVKKFLFWTGDNINEMYNSVSFRQIDAMGRLLNGGFGRN